MSDILTDHEIDLLIKLEKPLPEGYQSKIKTRSKRGHKEREFDVKGEDGSYFG